MRTTVEGTEDGTGAVLVLEGEFDLGSHDGLRDILREILEEIGGQGLEKLVVDLSRVPFVDSVGVLILMGVEMTARQKVGRLVIRGARPQVRKVFRMVGLDWELEDSPPD